MNEAVTAGGLKTKANVYVLSISDVLENFNFEVEAWDYVLGQVNFSLVTSIICRVYIKNS